MKWDSTVLLSFTIRARSFVTRDGLTGATEPVVAPKVGGTRPAQRSDLNQQTQLQVPAKLRRQDTQSRPTDTRQLLDQAAPLYAGRPDAPHARRLGGVWTAPTAGRSSPIIWWPNCGIGPRPCSSPARGPIARTTTRTSSTAQPDARTAALWLRTLRRPGGGPADQRAVQRAARPTAQPLSADPHTGAEATAERKVAAAGVWPGGDALRAGAAGGGSDGGKENRVAAAAQEPEPVSAGPGD